MADYHGDIRLGDTIDIQFTTIRFDTAVATTLAGTPVISAYIGNSVTQITAGITLTVDLDGVTGLHNVRVVATSGNGYTTATNVSLVITTGTVNAVSAVGYCVGSFSIENRSGLMPTTAGRTLDVASTGEAGLDYNNVNLPVGTVASLGILDNGTMQAGSTGTTAVLRSAADFGANTRPVGMTIIITGGTGFGQSRAITAYANATDTATVDPWTTTPDNTSAYIVIGTAPASTSVPIAANLTQWNGTAVATPATAGVPDVNAMNVGGQTASASGTVTFPNAILASTTNITAGTITTVTNLTNAPTAGDLTATMKTSVTTACTASTPTAAAVTGAVGSVTGNVGGNVAGSVGSVTGAVGSVTGAVGSVTGAVGSVTLGVTVTTNNDKTGYALTQSFPTNFSALSITVGGKIDVGKLNGTTLNGDGAATPWGP